MRFSLLRLRLIVEIVGNNMIVGIVWIIVKIAIIMNNMKFVNVGIVVFVWIVVNVWTIVTVGFPDFSSKGLKVEWMGLKVSGLKA